VTEDKKDDLKILASRAKIFEAIISKVLRRHVIKQRLRGNANPRSCKKRKRENRGNCISV